MSLINQDQLTALVRSAFVGVGFYVVGSWHLASQSVWDSFANATAPLLVSAASVVAGLLWTLVANAVTRKTLLHTAPPGKVIVPAAAAVAAGLAPVSTVTK